MTWRPGPRLSLPPGGLGPLPASGSSSGGPAGTQFQLDGPEGTLFCLHTWVGGSPSGKSPSCRSLGPWVLPALGAPCPPTCPFLSAWFSDVPRCLPSVLWEPFQPGALPLGGGVCLRAPVSMRAPVCVRACKPPQSCLPHFDSMDCACPAPLPMGLSREEYRSGLPCLPPGDPPDPGTELRLLQLVHRILYH